MTGFVSTDVNSECQKPDKRLLNALLNIVFDQSPASTTQHIHLQDRQHIPTLSSRKRLEIFGKCLERISAVVFILESTAALLQVYIPFLLPHKET
jgi:hypothetical protein